MKIKIIEKSDINELLKETIKDWSVYIPQKNFGDDIWFEVLPKEDKKLTEALKRVSLEDEDIVISPKDIFFPQLETMFEFKKENVKETIESSSKLLFGIKPCDLKGVLFVDDFFKRNLEDKYYLSRIQDRFIIVIGCLQPPRPSACFCASAKTGPFAESGYDLQFIDIGDAYLVEVGSPKGEEFLSKYTNFFKDFSGDADKIINQIKSKACDSVELKVDFQKALNRMEDDEFIPEENYKSISERCIYCGACLYACPTCTCFNVFDQVKEEGIRCRNWDACVFEGYTREASGHNPREDKKTRTARRYEHKLKYDNKVTGISGCVACGRCLTSCPVNIGMSKFIREIIK